MSSPLVDLLASPFRDRAAEPALEWQKRCYSFGDLDERSRRLAHELAARGISPGDRLAVCLPNRIEFVDLVLACVRCGVILVPINVLYREREAGHILSDASPRALVLDGTPPAPTAVPVWPIDELAAAAARRSATPLQVTLGPDTTVALIYTSGTTGPAKGAILTHANFAANAATLLEAWQITRSDRLLLALPLFHVHGLGNGLFCWLASAGRLRLLPRFDHAAIARDMLDFAPTLFFGVPTMYVRLLDVPPDEARRIGAATRLFVSGSAPLAPAVFESFEARFGHRILERYGMTETMMTLSNPVAGERRPGTVGLPLPGVSIRIVDRTGGDVTDGETGELLVRSATVCAGYWNRPDASAAAFSDGWFRTGDLASRTPDGYVTLRGRVHELIISGGFNVYPREIEEVLIEHPAIAEAAVAGVTHAVRGEVPVAFVVPRPGRTVNADDVREFCRARLASFKVPHAVIEIDVLPRTALGKVQKKVLVDGWSPTMKNVD